MGCVKINCFGVTELSSIIELQLLFIVMKQSTLGYHLCFTGVIQLTFTVLFEDRMEMLMSDIGGRSRRGLKKWMNDSTSFIHRSAIVVYIVHSVILLLPNNSLTGPLPIIEKHTIFCCQV